MGWDQALEALPPRLRLVMRRDCLIMLELQDILGMSRVHLSRLNGLRNEYPQPDARSLPAPRNPGHRPLVWDTEEIIRWALQSGRLDPITGEPSKTWRNP